MAEKKTKEIKKTHDEPQYPEAIVGALIVNKEGKILLSPGKKWGGKYTIFGGHVELGETLEEAVKREAKEETGLDVEVINKIRFGESIFDKAFYKKRHFIYLDFLCKYDGDGEAVKTNEEFEDSFKWYSVEEALKLAEVQGTLEIIEAYKKYLENKNNLDGWKRCQADFENYKKMQAQSLKDLAKYATQNIVLQLIPVLDNFHMSTEHVPKEQKNSGWVVGIMHIQKQLENILSENGVEEITTKEGDKFNPEIHEAVENSSQSIVHSSEKGKNDHEPRTTNQELIKKILMKGYKMGDKIIRPAKVIVG